MAFKFRTTIYIIFFTLCCFISSATTIRPFASLLELHEKATCVVLTQYSDTAGHVAIRLYKGEFNTVRPWGNDTIVILGDPVYQDGVNYVLFLDELDKPICLSYYVFAQTDSFFVRSPAEGIHVMGDPDRGNAFPAREFLTAVKDKNYKNLKPVTRRLGRAAPAGCSYLQNASGTRYRWHVWDTSAITPVWVHPNLGGDKTCLFASATVDDAIDSMRINYMGTNLRTGDPHLYKPSCTGASAIGAEYRSHILAEFGDSKRILVQFNDPCSEISDLSGCSGTLAVGGLFATDAHVFDGAAWFSGGFGFVIVNNGISCIGCTDNLRAVIMHEVGHAIGLGHISSGVGVANMNATCCNEITGVDMTCVDYVYPSVALPVEFIDVTVRSAAGYNEINWQIGAEVNTEKYVLEVSDDGMHFEPYAEVTARNRQNYSVIHWAAGEKTYYRIKSVDWDGTITLSKIIYVNGSKVKAALLTPVINQGDQIELYTPGMDKILITDTLGRQMYETMITTGYSTINQTLPPGTYVLIFSWTRQKYIITIL